MPSFHLISTLLPMKNHINVPTDLLPPLPHKQFPFNSCKDIVFGTTLLHILLTFFFFGIKKKNFSSPTRVPNKHPSFPLNCFLLFSLNSLFYTTFKTTPIFILPVSRFFSRFYFISISHLIWLILFLRFTLFPYSSHHIPSNQVS